MLPRELRWLWNEQVPPGFKCKVVREHSVVDQDHNPTLYKNFRGEVLPVTLSCNDNNVFSAFLQDSNRGYDNHFVVLSQSQWDIRSLAHLWYYIWYTTQSHYSGNRSISFCTCIEQPIICSALDQKDLTTIWKYLVWLSQVSNLWPPRHNIQQGWCNIEIR